MFPSYEILPVGKAGLAIVVPVKLPVAFSNLPVPPVIVWVITTFDLPPPIGVDVPLKVV
jgi:hypothetical protein